MIRIFVTFPISNPLSESLIEISKSNSHLEKTRWTPKENLHITLFFIGEVRESTLEMILSNLQKVFSNQNTFSLEFDSIIFKGRKHPSMLWAMFKKNNLFSELSQRIYESVKEFMTITPSHADPIPHCTLARLKPGSEISSFDNSINLSQSKIIINTAELWQTIQTKEGVRYKSLRIFSMN